MRTFFVFCWRVEKYLFSLVFPHTNCQIIYSIVSPLFQHYYVGASNLNYSHTKTDNIVTTWDIKLPWRKNSSGPKYRKGLACLIWLETSSCFSREINCMKSTKRFNCLLYRKLILVRTASFKFKIFQYFVFKKGQA